MLRPFLLRRLKKDVEKEMPQKVEVCVKCSLSRRQQSLYEALVHRRETRRLIQETVMGTKGGGGRKLTNILMSLRKVCNHPELFEPRLVLSPFVMAKRSSFLPLHTNSDMDVFEDAESEISLDIPSFFKIHFPNVCRLLFPRFTNLIAAECFSPKLQSSVCHEIPLNFSQYAKLKLSTFPVIQEVFNDFSSQPLSSTPFYSSPTPEKREIMEYLPTLGSCGIAACRFVKDNTKFSSLRRGVRERLDDFPFKLLLQCGAIEKCIAPPPSSPFLRETAPSLSFLDPCWPIERDRRLLLPPVDQVFIDCGKFAEVSRILVEQWHEGNKCVIFTQMNRMLDILEVFLNSQGFRYVRLDGSTPAADRLYLVERFNRTPINKAFVFISSTRAGGVGINLTGANNVIFFDTDWNPAMDRQAMDR